METSQPLPTESFSYRWLMNLRPSFEAEDGSFRASLEASDEAAFIVMDGKMLSSERFLGDAQDFNFATCQTSLLVHADEVFSNGLLMPSCLTPSKVETFATLGYMSSSSPTCGEAYRFLNPSDQRKHSSKVWVSWKKIIKKHFRFLRSFSQKLQYSNHDIRRSFSTRGERIHACRRMVKSEGSSPRISTGFSTNDCSDIEKSIQEAVLHCKKSFGK